MSFLYTLMKNMCAKRRAQIANSGFTSPTNSEHMAAIVHNGVVIAYGSNYHKTNHNCMVHAEYDAFNTLLMNNKYKKEKGKGKGKGNGKENNCGHCNYSC